MILWRLEKSQVLLLQILWCGSATDDGAVRFIHAQVGAMVGLKPVDDPGDSIWVAPPSLVVSGAWRLLNC